MRQKLGLFAIFFLTAITMVFSLVRVIVGLRGVREDDVWFFLCATIEVTIGKYYESQSKGLTKLTQSLAIVIACLVSYRSLFTQESKSKSKSSKYKSYAMANHYHDERTSRSNPYTKVTGTGRNGTSSGSGSTTQDRAEVVPLDMIRVKNEFEIHSPPLATTDRNQTV